MPALFVLLPQVFLAQDVNVALACAWLSTYTNAVNVCSEGITSLCSKGGELLCSLCHYKDYNEITGSQIRLPLHC